MLSFKQSTNILELIAAQKGDQRKTSVIPFSGYIMPLAATAAVSVSGIVVVALVFTCIAATATAVVLAKDEDDNKDENPSA